MRVADETLDRLRAVDWIGKPEATISSQLITPVLMLLGYGDHTLHKVAEQQSYTLRDPYVSKGSRRIRFDYQPRVYEEGLWVMEAKGTDVVVDDATLGQVRDYAIHPEVRAALMVTVDLAGFRVFDPWDEHWDEPLLTLGVNEVADRIDELRAVLGVDRVADVIRRRHLDHLRRALSASLEFNALVDADREFRAILREAEAAISERRRAIHRKAREDADALHERVVGQSGVWGVAQHHNKPWPGRYADFRDFATAVLTQDEPQRPTQILQVEPAIEAAYRPHIPPGAPAFRPLWWLSVVVVGGCIRLRGEPGCEPYATEVAASAIRDCLLDFPDDPLAAGSWRYQRVMIPLAARLTALAPFEELSADAMARLSPEDRIRYRPDPSWFFAHAFRNMAIRMLAVVDPWTVEHLDAQTTEATASLGRIPVPPREWLGPASDPWLVSWADINPLLMSGLAALAEHNGGDDLVAADDELRAAIAAAASSEHELLRRPAVPLVERFGLGGG